MGRSKGEMAQSTLKSTSRVENSLRMNELTVIVENQDELGGEEKAVMNVPFSVVKLSLDSNLYKVVMELDPGFFRVYDRNSRDPKQHWQINPKGYYMKYLEFHKIIIAKPGYLY